MTLAQALQKVTARRDMSAEESACVFDEIFAGKVPAEDLAMLLRGLHDKGESKDEILGAVRSMRAHMNAIPAPAGALDIVGTGGDHHGTFNVSTATALVVAGCGVPVAKHGNRAATSKSGSSDVLAALGVELEATPDLVAQRLSQHGIAFLFAPNHHPAMKYVAEVRRGLGIRTIFNLLGPLTNPANVKRHMIGVFDTKWLVPMAEVLRDLGSERAWFVHGHDGLDEISTTGPTDIVELRDGKITSRTITPEDAGIPHATLDDLKGSDPEANAEAIRQLLAGQKGPFRDIVVLNTAAALIVAGKTEDIKEGVFMAYESLDTGAAHEKLKTLIGLTPSGP